MSELPSIAVTPMPSQASGSTVVKPEQRGSKKKLIPNETTPAKLTFGPKSASSITKKKDLVHAIRRSKSALVLDPSAAAQWDVQGQLKTSMIDDSSVQQQLCIVENGVNYSARKLNDLKVSNVRATLELKGKLDELQNQRKNYDDMEAMKNNTTMEGLQIEKLEIDTNAVADDIRKSVHYSRQLEYVLLRLRRNQIKFDAHMNGMTDALEGVERESRDVRLLRRDLDSGLSRATLALEDTQRKLAHCRLERETCILQRRGEVKNAHMLQEWLTTRASKKKEMYTTLAGDMTKDEELMLISQLKEKKDITKNLQKANEDSQKQLAAMEEEFFQLKLVTAVSSLEEMLEKVSSQKPKMAELSAEVKEAESKLAATKKDTLMLERQFQDLKSSGVGMADVSREVTSKLERDIQAARQEGKVTRAQMERLSTVLVALQQGALALSQRVRPYLYMTENAVFDILTQIEEDSPWIDTINALSTAEQVLAKMMECSSTETGNLGKTNEDDDDESTDGLNHDIDDEVPTMTNNVRILSRKHDVMGDVVDVGEEEEEELSHGNHPHPTSDTTVDTGSTTTHTTIEGVLLNAVKSRQALKKDAMRTSLDAIHRQEQEIRNTKLAEKMKTGEIDLSGIGAAARYRSQLQHTQKLSTVHQLPTLPPGVTLRDDAMTKSNAFLTASPDLI